MKKSQAKTLIFYVITANTILALLCGCISGPTKEAATTLNGAKPYHTTTTTQTTFASSRYADTTVEEILEEPVRYSQRRVCIFADYKQGCGGFLDEKIGFQDNIELKAVRLLDEDETLTPPLDEELTDLEKTPSECQTTEYGRIIACGLLSDMPNGGYMLSGDMIISAGDAKPESIIAENISNCKRFSSPVRRDICIFDFVVNKRENDDCGQISDNAIRSSCNWNLALIKKDEKLCETLDFGLKGYFLKNSRVYCLEDVAFITSNPEICRKLDADYYIGGCLARIASRLEDPAFCMDKNEEATTECLYDYNFHCSYDELARCLKINCKKDDDCDDLDDCTKDECLKGANNNSETWVCKHSPMANCSYGEWDDFSTPEKTWETYISGLREKNKEKVNSCLTSYSKQKGAAHNDVSRYDSVLSFLEGKKFKAEISGDRAFLWPDPPTTKFGPVFMARENGRWKIELQLVRENIIYDLQNTWYWKYNDETLKDKWLKQ